MTDREKILAESCAHDGCGARAGERCRPITVLFGYHLERLRAAGLDGNVRAVREQRRKREIDRDLAKYEQHPRRRW